MSCFRSAVLMTALLTCSHAWAVNKCTLTDGSVSFQDAPCPKASAPARDVLAEARAQAKASDAPDNKALKEWVARENSKQRATASTDERPSLSPDDQRRHEMAQVCKGDYAKAPAVGMAERVLQLCLGSGEPALIDQTDTLNGVTRTYAYGRGANGLLLYVIVKNGVVVLVKH